MSTQLFECVRDSVEKVGQLPEDCDENRFNDTCENVLDNVYKFGTNNAITKLDQSQKSQLSDLMLDVLGYVHEFVEYSLDRRFSSDSSNYHLVMRSALQFLIDDFKMCGSEELSEELDDFANDDYLRSYTSKVNNWLTNCHFPMDSFLYPPQNYERPCDVPDVHWWWNEREETELKESQQSSAAQIPSSLDKDAQTSSKNSCLHDDTANNTGNTTQQVHSSDQCSLHNGHTTFKLQNYTSAGSTQPKRSLTSTGSSPDSDSGFPEDFDIQSTLHENTPDVNKEACDNKPKYIYSDVPSKGNNSRSLHNCSPMLGLSKA